ncbi:cathecol O-methyltransferase 1-like isoform X2 [Prosopis cineraria]|uniref:cathecol O-methyltransferase 1-like isoform X2 n=1 Tax=Prosopis cineraria TaxID=364024 RepID=UPI00240EC810|nr:cathecol O-methyltransferase 1-like isoform X2 [Prosopis cineraria]
MAQSQQSHSQPKPLHDAGNNHPLKQHSPEIDDVEEESFSYAMQLATSTAISMAMQTAVELGIFDVIHRVGHDARMSAAEIATELSCKNSEAPSALDRLLWLLASHSVLTCSVVADEDQGQRCFRRLYGLSPVAKFFARNAEGVSLGPFIALIQDKVFIESWRKLKDAISDGGIAFNKVHGSHAFEYPKLDSRFNDVFNKAMVNQTTLVVTKILEYYKGFGNITRLVDVGGGLGITLSLITSKYPNIQGINFDLPHVIQHAPPYPGVEHVGGDMFESVPKGDAVFMKWILHDWSDEWCLKLLKNCHNAIPEDGKVIVVDAILHAVPEISASAKSTSQLDMIMMTQNPGGRERSEEEFMELARSAGFRGVRYECFVRNFWIMEFYK